MSQTPDTPTRVGEQLRDRRKRLDLTQGALARRIGIDASTVSVTERGQTQIQRGKRTAWEQALELQSGTITRAYTDGTDLEPVTPTSLAPPYADMTDRHERAIWEMENLPVAARRTMIDILRSDRAEESRPTG